MPATPRSVTLPQSFDDVNISEPTPAKADPVCLLGIKLSTWRTIGDRLGLVTVLIMFTVYVVVRGEGLLLRLEKSIQENTISTGAAMNKVAEAQTELKYELRMLRRGNAPDHD